METLNQIMSALTPYLVTLVTAFAAYVVAIIKKKLTEKLDTQTKKDIAEATVNYVEQVFEDLDGKEKLQKALETSTQWLNEKGIKVTEAEMTMFIEAAIKGAKQGWNEQKLQEASVKALESQSAPVEMKAIEEAK